MDTLEVRVVVGGAVRSYKVALDSKVRDVLECVSDEFDIDLEFELVFERIKLLRFLDLNTFVEMKSDERVADHSPDSCLWVLILVPDQNMEDSEDDLLPFTEGLEEEALMSCEEGESEDSDSEEEAESSTIPAP